MSESFKQRLFPKLPAIAERFGPTFHIYDERGIRETIRRFKHAFSQREILFQEFFAVKALPNPAIMDIIKSEGCGFDCSSIRELDLARDAGARPEYIIFTSNDTSSEEFQEALSEGGSIINLDDEIFLGELSGPLPELLCFRLNSGDRNPSQGGGKIDTSSKYGVPLEQMMALVSRAKDRGVKRFGIHGMFFSNDLDYLNLLKSLNLLAEVGGGISNRLKISLEFIDVGGGFGIPYRLNESEFDLDSYAIGCRSILDQFARTYGYTPKLFAESGRYITVPHGVFVNPVINIYRKYGDFIGVPTAMPGLMRVGIYPSAYHHCTILDPSGVERTADIKPQTVAGPICEGCDVLARNMPLPTAYRGDFVVTHDTGAHGIAMGFNYNGRLRPQELMLCEDGSVIRIGHGETQEDLAHRYTELSGPEHVLKF